MPANFGKGILFQSVSRTIAALGELCEAVFDLRPSSLLSRNVPNRESQRSALLDDELHMMRNVSVSDADKLFQCDGAALVVLADPLKSIIGERAQNTAHLAASLVDD